LVTRSIKGQCTGPKQFQVAVDAQHGCRIDRPGDRVVTEYITLSLYTEEEILGLTSSSRDS
jgi:hypothetical protein